MVEPGGSAAAGKRKKRDESQSVSAVHERLRDAILDGDLKAGASIPQHLLADRFEAGRTPLREALRMLQSEGLVVAEPNHPVRIAPLSTDDLEEIFVRAVALESVAIRITVPKLVSDDFAELEAAMTKMDHYFDAEDMQGLRAPHRSFHHRLIAGAGPNVSAEIDTISDHAERYRLAVDFKSEWRKRRAEHRAILDAAKEGDADGAAIRLGEHYARSALLSFGALDPSRDLEPLRVTLRAVGSNADKLLGKRRRSRSRAQK
jgi:DNA-binding GntR family transcriptional regulator